PLPLTTIFTPPSDCLNDLWILKSNWTKNTYYWANLGFDDPARCLPWGWRSQSYYSPGRYPSGYTTTEQLVRGAETIATCCPIYTDWTFSPRTATNRPWHSFEACVHGIKSNVTYTAFNTNNGSSSKVTERKTRTSGRGWVAYGVKVRWRASDSIPALTASAESTSTSTATENSQATSQETSGLSTGVKAGIGVGVGFGGLLIFLALGFLLWRRRKPPHDTSSVANRPLTVQGQHELEAFKNQRHEAGANPLFEKDASQPRALAELDGSAGK
ncbi:hypothetical protein N7512_003887, partial [Penicillium capsulatum]